MRRDGRYRLGYQLGNANVLEIHGVGGKHHGRIVDFPQTRRSIAPSIRQTQRGTGDAVVQVDPGVHQRILFSNIVHLFRSTSADIVVTARGEQLCALSCDRIELKCTVRVQKVTAVLPDELACDALWFPRVRCYAILCKLPETISSETVSLTRNRGWRETPGSWVEKASTSDHSA